MTASNHPDLLDRAVWRRFQIRLELSYPTQGQIEEWFPLGPSAPVHLEVT